ncbi:MAG: hypothetical protein Q8K70_00860 [Bacteroidota bacterium]|nr:hypothetical protein [Bacteroidota bacterium]
MKNRFLKIIFVFFIGISILEINAQTPIIPIETPGKPIVTLGNFNPTDTVFLEEFFSQKGLTIKEENGAISQIVEFRVILLFKTAGMAEFQTTNLYFITDKMAYLKANLKYGDIMIIDGIKILNPLFSGYANPIVINLK